MPKATTTFSLRLTESERRLLEREAERLKMSPAALGRALVLRALEKGSPPEEPDQLHELLLRLSALEETLSRVDINLYNSVVLGLRLATGEEKLQQSAPWVEKHLQGE